MSIQPEVPGKNTPKTWIKFNILVMELHLDCHKYGSEPYRALKMKITKEKLTNNENLEGY